MSLIYLDNKKFFVVYEEGFVPKDKICEDHLTKITELFIVNEEEESLDHIIFDDEFKKTMCKIVNRTLEAPLDKETCDLVKELIFCTKPINFHNFNTKKVIIAYGKNEKLYGDCITAAAALLNKTYH